MSLHSSLARLAKGVEMAKEFWNELLTQASWEKLVELSRKYDFILIGGWAAYLWTKAHKSKDIDIVVDQTTLSQLKRDFPLLKNDRLRKYEIKFEKFDVDVYLAHYSKLAIPPEELKNYSSKVEGIRTVRPEALLVLKQAAEIERRWSAKGVKDSIDIVTVMFYAELDWKAYSQLLEKYGKESFVAELASVVQRFDEKNIRYLGVGFKQFKDWKKKVLDELKMLDKFSGEGSRSE